jgi:DNA polymerase III delta subunit
MPVIVMAGEEDFTLYRQLEDLKKNLLDPAWVSFNYARHDNPPPQDVIDLASGLPFGPGNKVIVLDRIDWFAKKRAAKSDDTAAGAKRAAKKEARETVNEDALAEALGAVHPSTYLIFVATANFDSTLRLSKLVAKVAKLEKFEKAKHWPGSISAPLRTWCQKEAHRVGATIDEEASDYLIDGLEANLRQIASEIAKAAIFVMPKTHITLATLKTISPHHSHIFVLADLWLSGKMVETYQALKELQTKQNNMATLATLQTFMSKWVNLKAICQFYNDKAGGPGVQRRELSDSDLAGKVAQEMGTQAFVVEKDIKRLKHVSLDFLVDKRNELTRLEHMVKTGQMSDAHAIDLFFFREKSSKRA